MNAIFYRDEAQKKAALASAAREAARRNISIADIKTPIVPMHKFTYAEDYHQKYYLTRHRAIRQFLTKTYPDAKSLADSAVATRLNAYLGSGFEKDYSAFRKELSKYGLPPELIEQISF